MRTLPFFFAAVGFLLGEAVGASGCTCGGGGEGGGAIDGGIDAGVPPWCAAEPCPPGAYSVCGAVPATPTTCCVDDVAQPACGVDGGGYLTHDCPGCPDDGVPDGIPCAVTSAGVLLACDLNL